MPKTLRSRRPFGKLFDRLRAHSADRLALQQTAQLALQVEFATVPVYLSGLYSVKDRDCVAYQALRSVVMEEMFHINQAANLVVALGALPRFTGQAAPEYPSYLPHANEATTPLLGLYRASTDVFENVFAAIETPAPAGAPPQGDHYDTIAQLYGALSNAIQRYPGSPFEPPAREGRQRLDIYIGKFGGKVLPITDKPSAQFAIEQIVQQGEGTVPAGSPMIPVEPLGAYNHYGRRTDGTYGPIIGLPAEMSHFSKFRQVALDKENFPPTLPITSNPDAADFSNPEARELAGAFNLHYSVMLHALEVTFLAGPGDPYFSIVLNLMHHVLPQLAISLMNTPAHLNGDGSVGPNAAPTWHYEPQARLAALAPTLRATLDRRALPAQALGPLAAALQGLERLTQKFYVGPEAYRGLPLNPDGAPFTERDFRDAEGRMCRQAARFKIYRDTPQGKWRAACRGRSFPLWTWSPQADPPCRPPCRPRPGLQAWTLRPRSAPQGGQSSRGGPWLSEEAP